MATKSRKGRNPLTGEVAIKRKKPAKRAKVAKRARPRRKTVRIRSAIPRDVVGIRLTPEQIEALDLKARELDISFSEVIRQGLAERYNLPETPLRKEKVLG